MMAGFKALAEQLHVCGLITGPASVQVCRGVA
jgi:hypothetical protein